MRSACSCVHALVAGAEIWEQFSASCWSRVVSVAGARLPLRRAICRVCAIPPTRACRSFLLWFAESPCISGRWSTNVCTTNTGRGVIQTAGGDSIRVVEHRARDVTVVFVEHMAGQRHSSTLDYTRIRLPLTSRLTFTDRERDATRRDR